MLLLSFLFATTKLRLFNIWAPWVWDNYTGLHSLKEGTTPQTLTGTKLWHEPQTSIGLQSISLNRNLLFWIGVHLQRFSVPAGANPSLQFAENIPKTPLKHATTWPFRNVAIKKSLRNPRSNDLKKPLKKASSSLLLRAKSFSSEGFCPEVSANEANWQVSDMGLSAHLFHKSHKSSASWSGGEFWLQ